jgi:molybdenum cofactor synthesis domain-containing protein
MKYKAVIITISDKGSRGERKDESGPALENILKKYYTIEKTFVIPDDKETIAHAIKEAIDSKGVDLVVTTGGTGVGKRDNTPEATRMVIEKELPGFSEIMRVESYKITPHGIISRGICGIRKEGIIINLPGSPKAAVECLNFVLNAIAHALDKVKGDEAECGQALTD